MGEIEADKTDPLFDAAAQSTDRQPNLDMHARIETE